MNAAVVGRMQDRSGIGVVRLEVVLPVTPAELWPALTEPERLKGWIGTVVGDLGQGGSFTASWFASGWEGTGRVLACNPPERLLLLTRSEDEPEGAVELTLSAEGDGTRLVLEDRGMPVAALPAYAAGDQIHLEDLAAYLGGGPPCDARARWQELHAVYLDHEVQTV